MTYRSITPFIFTVSLLGSTALLPSVTMAQDEAPVPTLPSFDTSKGSSSGNAAVTAAIGGEAGVKFIDNVFRAPSNEQNDTLYVLKPGFEIKARDNSTGKYTVSGNVEAGRYASHDENDYLDGDLRVKGRHMATDNAQFSWYGRLRADHVAIGSSIDEPERNLSEPVTYRQGEAGAQVDVLDGNNQYLLAADSLIYNYDNTQRLDGTTSIYDDRDRQHYQLTAKAGHRPDDSMVTYYVLGNANTRSYRHRVDSNAANSRDSNGYLAAVGATYGDGTNDKVWADGYIGYLTQQYDAAFFKDVSGVALGGQASWQARDDLRLSVRAGREVRETTLTGASGYLRTQVKGEAEYVVNPEWTVEGEVSYTNNDFEVNPASGQPDREDDVYGLAVEPKYHISDEYAVGLQYAYLNKDSTDAGSEYDTSSLFARFYVKY